MQKCQMVGTQGQRTADGCRLFFYVNNCGYVPSIPSISIEGGAMPGKLHPYLVVPSCKQLNIY